MTKLLIADRDRNERTGINWLVNSYAIPFEKVLLSGSVKEVIQLIESEIPDVLCLELDMIPIEKLPLIKELKNRYNMQVIAMTTEATYERAFQGIQLGVIDLWVKPLSPDVVKRVLSKSCINAEQLGEKGKTIPKKETPQLSYQSIFHYQESTIGQHQIMLIKLEEESKQHSLLSFIHNYPFTNPPVILPLSDMIVCIFSITGPSKKHMLSNIGNQILREWEESYSEALSIIIYDPETSLSLHEKYIHAKQLLETRFYKGTRKLFYITEKIEWLGRDPFLTPVEQRLWIEMLGQGKREQLKEWMYNEFLQQEEPFSDPGLQRIRLTSILAQVSRYMKSHGITGDSIQNNYLHIFNVILYNPILYRIVQEFLLFIYEVLDLATKQNQTLRKDLVEQAIQFMEGNYSHPEITLEDVAEFVDRSPAYLSSLFTKSQGISFKGKLTELRIRAAEKLLLETNLPIQEIARKSGFEHANYFSKIFKERIGITPRMYKNRKKSLKL
ncbi:helix-turn-helix domain-containing protein [Bacillus suaedaesalsae]|uniref:Helix-turn-helix domain-containing protein n=1 Tax=Bacillus suaedaesalsae TaxID=2810349 RepID=A0ABS2DCT1_9BACI|nr:helix-turn-helix domain-containing protein [Bacillus suaedaesalsae]MBM6616270.1 helix-turn-helix domain-containing protein [Bacillus suaedaesalsae]